MRIPINEMIISSATPCHGYSGWDHLFDGSDTFNGHKHFASIADFRAWLREYQRGIDKRARGGPYWVTFHWGRKSATVKVWSDLSASDLPDSDVFSA